MNFVPPSTVTVPTQQPQQQQQAAPVQAFGPNDTLPLQSTASVSVDGGIKVLVYGGAGVGKTRLCMTLPNPVIISAEGGLLSLRKENLPFYEISSMADFDRAYQWAANSQQARQFNSLGIDSISEIAERILAHEKANSKDPRKAYGTMADLIMQYLRAFRDLRGFNVYFSAKQGRFTDYSTGGVLWGPMMPGQQVDQQIPYFVDEVFHITPYVSETGERYPILRTFPDNQYAAKDRSGALAPWEMAHLGYIFDKIRKG